MYSNRDFVIRIKLSLYRINRDSWTSRALDVHGSIWIDIIAHIGKR